MSLCTAFGAKDIYKLIRFRGFARNVPQFITRHASAVCNVFVPMWLMGSQYIGQHVVQIRHDTTHSSFGTVTPQVPDLTTIVTGLVVAM